VLRTIAVIRKAAELQNIYRKTYGEKIPKVQRTVIFITHYKYHNRIQKGALYLGQKLQTALGRTPSLSSTL
jgi:hypothetical protein